MGKTGKTFLTEHTEEVYSVHNYMMDAGEAEKERKKNENKKKQRERIHPIGLIFTLIIISYICGRSTLPGIHRYLKHRKKWLKKLLGDDFQALPSLVTFYRAVWETDFELFRWYLEEWVRRLLDKMKYAPGSVFMDGKSIRAASEYNAKSDKKQAPYIVHAVLRLTDKNEKRLDLYLSSELVGPKSNEIPNIPILLQRIEPKNKYVSLDAIGTQIEVFQQVEKDGGILVVPLKDNHKNTREDIADHIQLMMECGEVSVYDSGLEKGHGRYERRTAYAVSNVGADLRTGFDTARYSCIITREREDMKTGKTTSGTFYYLSNKKLTAEEFAFHARDHWGIEERNNWMDERLSEDRCFVRKGNGMGNLALLRRFAHNIIQIECYRSNVDLVGFNEHFDNFDVLKRAVFTNYPLV